MGEQLTAQKLSERQHGGGARVNKPETIVQRGFPLPIHLIQIIIDSLFKKGRLKICPKIRKRKLKIVQIADRLDLQGDLTDRGFLTDQSNHDDIDQTNHSHWMEYDRVVAIFSLLKFIVFQNAHN